MITLLTDFGLSDIYVGVMKGVIAQINPNVTIIELTHNIPPQNLLAARFCLINAYPYFPLNTIHLVVVDPQVGTNRKGILIQTPNAYFIGPDNGIFTPILDSATSVVQLNKPEYWLSANPSSTFHGRDIFAPVAAHLSKGISLHQLGTPLDPTTLTTLDIPKYQLTPNGIIGSIQYIDHFGNLITNIPHDQIKNQSWSVVIQNQTIPQVQTYHDGIDQKAIALIGSHNWIEIAINGRSAAALLNLTIGDLVEVMYD